jgi:bifunctional DNA-binding transcriptional regulator/antitoxin component of YhaV-PrlF toxin-antitoxin module
MYTIETAKMSSKGQLVVPEALRKRYGWRAGSTLLMLGASSCVLLQTLPVPDEHDVEKAIAETQVAAASVKTRLRDAKKSLDKLSSLAISLPVDIERDGQRRVLAERRHA